MIKILFPTSDEKTEQTDIILFGRKKIYTFLLLFEQYL